MHLETSVPLLVPDLPSPQELMPYLQRMHAARHYSNFGPLVCELEQLLAARFQVATPAASVTTASSATLALELALTALALPPGSKVLVPALTFVATATAVVRAGYVPVLGDVDPDSWLMTPGMAWQMRQHVAFDAVVPVATFGAPQDMAAWSLFEQSTGLPVIVDAAGAFGSQWLHGSQGTLVFSLHATKSLPAGEGGLVVSTNTALVAKVRQMSNFGINLQPGARVPTGVLASIGTNAKMSEYHAAVGLASLSRWDAGAQRRRELYSALRSGLDAATGDALRWQTTLPGGIVAPGLLCARMPSAADRLRLERLCQKLKIGTRRWYQPLLGEIRGTAARWESAPTPNANAIARDLIGLPFFPSMTAPQLNAVVEAVGQAVVSDRVKALV
ncbi:aminotransferase class I/II-fold pyridoxal phosphate-dependent enzyme [Rhodoferax sp.]|uniref:DegT/DnrJ/EryC1/StrS family aminotransferase n=1 Tax=Rhodoferax sp. TaxID=50421 RepID=UPI0025F1F3FA|nr:aminotransferase class I/II-fold pyridoxal phosphate-dependent enzyme [Rhodoferax sp.]